VFAARVASAPVQTAIDRLLRSRGIRGEHLDDTKNGVVAALLGMCDPPPDEERCLAAALAISENLAASYFRRRTARRKYDAGPTDLAGSASAQDDGAAPSAHANAQIAERFGCVTGTMANRPMAAREEVRTAWARRLVIVTIGGGLLAALPFLLRERDDRVVHSPPPPALSAQPRPEPRVDDLRARAFEACAAGRWNECAGLLDRARARDPGGESLLRVQAARGAIAARGAP
jgi:hypothetical protein